ncbi:hypothetical protein GS400_08230 [Pontibacillus sp. HMF3514]|nr:hypothetical protein GS400_08230 [Pontibacillus sp. HMF3514]
MSDHLWKTIKNPAP